MTHAALDRFAATLGALELTLDGHDALAIERANERFLAAIFDVRAIGAWRDRPDLARQAAELLGRVEIAQQRVKKLTRETRERLAALEAVRSSPALSLYARGGQTVR